LAFDSDRLSQLICYINSKTNIARHNEAYFLPIKAKESFVKIGSVMVDAVLGAVVVVTLDVVDSNTEVTTADEVGTEVVPEISVKGKEERGIAVVSKTD